MKGVQGMQGQQGFQGAIGQTGLTGSQGLTGANGLNGNNGSQGTQGLTGATGSTGQNGSNGNIGPTGLQGIQGLIGLAGQNGTAGNDGATGQQGIQGLAGIIGSNGLNGKTVLNGIADPTLTDGVDGDFFINGVTGVIFGPKTATDWGTGFSLIGQAGVVGPTGQNGAQGLTGATGQQGIQGLTGAQGLAGVAGATGQQGLVGSTGLTGNQGLQGLQGSQGIQGLTGAIGTAGQNGSNGIQGIQGLVGATGSTGQTGASGSQGLIGATGLTGSQGIQGIQGIQGLIGLAGVQGIQGNAGIAGTDGTNGLNGKSLLNGTTNPDAATGVEGDFYLNTTSSEIFGPKTATGWGNAISLIGATGATGTQGLTGAAGAQGIQGIDGLIGLTGLTGSQGITGATGLTGAVGATGTDGLQGIQGLVGLTGATGAQGLTGTTGLTGANGNDGNDGATGAQGIQGLIGLTGTQGIQGASGIVTANAPLTYDALTQSLSIQQANTIQDGYLSSADWNIFNNKQGAINASNGLTLAGADLKLGGELTQNTTIDGTAANLGLTLTRANLNLDTGTNGGASGVIKLGPVSLYSFITSDSSNIFFGQNSGPLYGGGIGNSDLLDQIGIGDNTLRNSLGSANVAIGSNSLTSHQNGGANSTLGVNSFSSLVTGDLNSGLGVRAGYNLISGDNNLALGTSTGFANNTGSNQLNIANNIFGTGLNGSIYDPVNGTPPGPAGFIGIGEINPSDKLTINSGYSDDSGLTLNRLSDTTPILASTNYLGFDNNGKVIRVNGLPTYTAGTGLSLFGTLLENTGVTTLNGFTGNLIIGGTNSVVGDGSNIPFSLINDSATPGNSRYYGTDALGNKGYQAIVPYSVSNGLTTSVSDFRLGGLLNQDTTIDGTTSNFGLSIFNSNLNFSNTSSTGTSGVIYFGGQKFISNYGGNNTFVGAGSGNTNTTGNANNSIGASTLTSLTSGFDNNAFGELTLSSNTSGYGNTAIGGNAMRETTTGFSNTASGSQSLIGNNTGSFNTANGSSTLFSNLTGDSNTASGFDSLRFSTGNMNTTYGVRSGINLTVGDNNLALGSNTNFASPTGSNQLNIANNIFGTGLSGSITSPAGLIGIGNVAPTNKLTVDDLTTTSVAKFNGSGSTQCTVVTGTGLTCSSDSRLKKNIVLGGGLDQINRLRGVQYNSLSGGDLQNGFIAQEVAGVIPNAVSVDSNGFLSLNQNAILPVTVNAIQELNKLIIANKLEIDTKFTALENRVNTLSQSSSSVSSSTNNIGAGSQVNGNTGVAATSNIFTQPNVFQQVVNFVNNIVVNGLATIQDLVVRGSAIFQGRVEFQDRDMAGVATILTNTKEIEVQYVTAYNFTPVVNVTSLGNKVPASLRSSNSQGFVIEIENNAIIDLKYNWVAINARGEELMSGTVSSSSTASSSSSSSSVSSSSSTSSSSQSEPIGESGPEIIPEVAPESIIPTTASESSSSSI